MGKIILRFSSSPDRSINTLAYNQLNYNGAFHLSIIKTNSLLLICIHCLRYARNVKRGDGRCHLYVNENYPHGSSFMQEQRKISLTLTLLKSWGQFMPNLQHVNSIEKSDTNSQIFCTPKFWKVSNKKHRTFHT